MKALSVVACVALFVSSVASQVTLLEPDFAVKTYPPSAGAKYITCSPGGIWPDGVFFADSGGGAIEHLAPDDTVSVFAGGLGFPVGMEFGPGPGATFGDFLYVADFAANAIFTVDPGGVVVPFVGATAPGDLVFDPSGVYGTDLFSTVAFAGPLSKLDPFGVATPFSPVAAAYMDFGPGGAWGTGMYSTDTFSAGIAKVDVAGFPTPFLTGMSAAEGFDWADGAGFGGDLFATDVGTGEILRVDSSGTSSLFALLDGAADVEQCDCGIYVVSNLGGCYKIYVPWVDLGAGLGGTGGTPVLVGTGELQGADPITLRLSGALGDANATLVIGFSQLNAGFKGGTLVPSPDVLITGLTTTTSGDLDISATWPTAVPSCVEVVLQYWISDPGGPKNFSASNGLSANTP